MSGKDDDSVKFTTKELDGLIRDGEKEMILQSGGMLTESEWDDLIKDESYCVLQMKIDGELFDKRFIILGSEDMEEKLTTLAKMFSTTYRLKKEE